MPVAPREPGSVHLVPEADDNLVTEIPDAVGVQAQVAVIVTVGDRRDRGESGIDLDERDNTMPVDHLREGRRERLGPAAVVPDEVGVLVRRLRKLLDRLVGRRRIGLEDAQVRVQGGRERRRQVGETGSGEADGDRGDHERQEHHYARSHAVFSPGKITRLTTARLSKPKTNRTANCKEPRVIVRQMARANQSRAMPPLHLMTPIRNRRSELPGVRVGCQPIDLPQAPSHIAKTCAQPRAIPRGQMDGPYLDRCHSG